MISEGPQAKAIVPTKAKVADGKWHDLTVVLQKNDVLVTLDGNVIVDRKFLWTQNKGDTEAATLWVGQSIDGNSGFDGWIDDVLVSRGAKKAGTSWKPDRDELVWLDFEESESEYLAKWTPVRSTRPDAEPWEKETDDDWMDDRFQRMTKGPFFACSTKLPGRYVGPKNLTIQLSDSAETGVLFDTQRCAVTAVVKKNSLRISPKRFGILQMPELLGDEMFYVDARQAWRVPTEGSTSVPLDESAVRFNGWYRHHVAPVVEYTVFGADVFESFEIGPRPAKQDWELLFAFERVFQVGRQTPLKNPVRLVVAEVPSEATGVSSTRMLHLKHGESVFDFRVSSDNPAVRLLREDHRILLNFPPGSCVASLVCLNSVQEAAVPPTQPFSNRFKTGGDGSDLPRRLTSNDVHSSFEKLTAGGDLLWTLQHSQQVKSNAVNGLPYAVDTIPPPFDNPSGALFFMTGLDFFANGRKAAVSTVHGDVWIVDGLSRDSQSAHWTRFASGLYQPLGLRIVDDIIVVLCRDQLTRLYDLNGDGGADYFENLNNDLVITGTPHAYASCLETDPAGNFYFFKCGRSLPHGGKLLRVSGDGKKLDVFASGYRHPIGLGISPTGLVTAADNQGNWIPASSIQVVSEGSFHGYMPEIHQPENPDTFDQPMCWLPVSFDNSSGSQIWVPNDDRWGPFGGKMLHLSWGRCTLNLVMTEKVDGVWQGGAVAFPGLKFDSGPIMGRFNLHDGQLYVCGLDGWQTAAESDGCFQRVRFTGGDVFMPTDLHAHQDGLQIKFATAVDKSIAADVASYEISQWQYRWSKDYGSPEYSIKEPSRIGHDAVTVSRVDVAADGRSVFLHVPDMKPVMQMEIRMNLAPNNGKQETRSIYNTIHKLRPPFND